MTWRNKRDYFNNYTCKWRNSDLGKTKPNHQYFMRLLKNETENFLRENKEYLLNNKPEIYYSMMNRKLPKKYIKKNTVVSPVNSYVPPQSKLTKEELDKKLAEELAERRLNEEKARKKKEIQDKELSMKRYNRETFLREQCYIRFVNPFEPINKNKLGSSQAWSKEKKYEYY